MEFFTYTMIGKPEKFILHFQEIMMKHKKSVKKILPQKWQYVEK